MSSPELLLLLTPLKNKISSEKKISREWFSTIFKIKKNIQSFFENEKFSFSGSCAVDFSKKLSSFMLEMEENMDGSEEEKYAFLFCLESLRFISSQVFCKYENEYANSKKIFIDNLTDSFEKQSDLFENFESLMKNKKFQYDGLEEDVRQSYISVMDHFIRYRDSFYENNEDIFIFIKVFSIYFSRIVKLNVSDIYYYAFLLNAEIKNDTSFFLKDKINEINKRFEESFQDEQSILFLKKYKIFIVSENILGELNRLNIDEIATKKEFEGGVDFLKQFLKTTESTEKFKKIVEKYWFLLVGEKIWKLSEKFKTINLLPSFQNENLNARAIDFISSKIEENTKKLLKVAEFIFVSFSSLMPLEQPSSSDIHQNQVSFQMNQCFLSKVKNKSLPPYKIEPKNINVAEIYSNLNKLLEADNINDHFFIILKHIELLNDTFSFNPNNTQLLKSLYHHLMAMHQKIDKGIPYFSICFAEITKKVKENLAGCLSPDMNHRVFLNELVESIEKSIRQDNFENTFVFRFNVEIFVLIACKTNRIKEMYDLLPLTGGYAKTHPEKSLCFYHACFRALNELENNKSFLEKNYKLILDFIVVTNTSIVYLNQKNESNKLPIGIVKYLILWNLKLYEFYRSGLYFHSDKDPQFSEFGQGLRYTFQTAKTIYPTYYSLGNNIRCFFELMLVEMQYVTSRNYLLYPYELLHLNLKHLYEYTPSLKNGEFLYLLNSLNNVKFYLNFFYEKILFLKKNDETVSIFKFLELFFKKPTEIISNFSWFFNFEEGVLSKLKTFFEELFFHSHDFLNRFPDEFHSEVESIKITHPMMSFVKRNIESSLSELYFLVFFVTGSLLSIQENNYLKNGDPSISSVNFELLKKSYLLHRKVSNGANITNDSPFILKKFKEYFNPQINVNPPSVFWERWIDPSLMVNSSNFHQMTVLETAYSIFSKNEKSDPEVAFKASIIFIQYYCFGNTYFKYLPFSPKDAIEKISLFVESNLGVFISKPPFEKFYASLIFTELNRHLMGLPAFLPNKTNDLKKILLLIDNLSKRYKSFCDKVSPNTLSLIESTLLKLQKEKKKTEMDSFLSNLSKSSLFKVEKIKSILFSLKESPPSHINDIFVFSCEIEEMNKAEGFLERISTIHSNINEIALKNPDIDLSQFLNAATKKFSNPKFQNLFSIHFLKNCFSVEMPKDLSKMLTNQKNTLLINAFLFLSELYVLRLEKDFLKVDGKDLICFNQFLLSLSKLDESVYNGLFKLNLMGLIKNSEEFISKMKKQDEDSLKMKEAIELAKREKEKENQRKLEEEKKQKIELEKKRQEENERRKLAEEKFRKEYNAEKKRQEEKLRQEQEEKKRQEEKLRQEQEEKKRQEEKLRQEQEEKKRQEEKLCQEQEEKKRQEEKLRQIKLESKKLSPSINNFLQSSKEVEDAKKLEKIGPLVKKKKNKNKEKTSPLTTSNMTLFQPPPPPVPVNTAPVYIPETIMQQTPIATIMHTSTATIVFTEAYYMQPIQAYHVQPVVLTAVYPNPPVIFTPPELPPQDPNPSFKKEF